MGSLSQKVLREIQSVLSRLTGRGMCELYRQVGAVWGRRPWSWDVAVLAGLFQEGEKLVELVVLWIPCWSISCHSSSYRLLGGRCRWGSFLPKLAQTVFTKPGRCCSFCLHCTSQKKGTLAATGMDTARIPGTRGMGAGGAAQPETDYVCFLKLPTLSYRVTANRSQRDSCLMPF